MPNYFCTNCGSPVSKQAFACTSCGVKPVGHKKFCRQCAAALLDSKQVICVKCNTKVSTGVFASLTDVNNIKTFGAGAVKSLKTFSADNVKMLRTLFAAFWICTGGGLLSQFLGVATAMDVAGAEAFGVILLLIGSLGSITGAILGCVLMCRLWVLISMRIAKPTTPPSQIHLAMRRIPFGVGFIYSLLAEAHKMTKGLNKILQQRGIPLQANEWLALSFFVALVVMVVTWSFIPLPTFWSFSFMAVCGIGIFHVKAITDGTIALLKQEGQTENGQAAAPQATEEKFRIFRAGNLLGMITAQEIEAKYADKVLQQTDFVLLPLETFLAAIKTPDKPFQLFRDGKRIDQYTLQQINELHANGQTQPIDHVLLPMQVFLERRSS